MRRGGRNMRRERGFTLIELAIVLVIIGIILGLVLKGQDVIQNARMKKLVNDGGRKWETAIWTCFDRLGRFPGDSNNDGIIDTDPLTEPCIQNLANAPERSMRLGSYTFYVYAGFDNNNRNVIAVCPASNCDTPCGDGTCADFLRAFDVALDGVESATSGVVRLLSSTTITSNIVSRAQPATAGNWSSASVGLLYYFDRRP